MKFLCEPHRRMMQQFPDIARARWEEWMCQGYQALKLGNWRQALMFYGCSFEISEWLLDCQLRESGTVDLQTLDQVMVSGHLLAESFGHDGNVAMERHYLLAVHKHLTAVVGDNLHAGEAVRLRKNLELSLVMLKRHCRERGTFGGSEACIHNARTLLDAIPDRARVH